MTHSAPVDLTTTTVSRSGRSEITSSTCCLTGMNLPFRRAPSGMISALARETSIRSRTAVGSEAAEDDGMRRADAGAGEHGHDDLGNHRQVDADDVTLAESPAP